jgi:hypothetical protein
MKYRTHCANVPTKHDFQPMRKPKTGLLTYEAKQKVKAGHWIMWECSKCGTQIVTD